MLGTLGRYLVILGGSVYLVEVMIDGFATKFFADRWSEAADPRRRRFSSPAPTPLRTLVLVLPSLC